MQRGKVAEYNQSRRIGTEPKPCKRCGTIFTTTRHGNAVPHFTLYYCDECYTYLIQPPQKLCKRCGVEFRPRSIRSNTTDYCNSCRVLNNKELKQQHREKLRKVVLSHYSNGTLRCACCGESHIQFLAIDHKDGGGAKHRAKLNELGYRGNGIFRWLKKNNFPSGYRVLCHNCNTSIGHYGFCPHDKDDAATSEP